MYCDHCGSSIDSSFQFCARCGNTIRQLSRVQLGQSPPSSFRRSKSTPKVLILSVLVIFVTFIGLIVYGGFSKDGISEARKILEQARETTTSIPDRYQKSYVLRGIALAQAKAGDLGSALETAGIIHDESQRAYALAGVALAQAKAGNRDSAAKTFQQASHLALSIKGHSILGIALQQANAGFTEDAYRTASSIKDSSQRISALASIAKTESMRKAEDGNVKGAIQICGTIQASDEKALCLRFVAKVEAEGGNIEPSLKIIADITEPVWKAVALSDIARASAKAGKRNILAETYRKALVTTTVIKDRNDQDFVLSLIAEAQAEGGDVIDALQTMAGIQKDYYKVKALISVGTAQQKLGDRGSFQNSFQQAFSMVASIPESDHQTRDALRFLICEAQVQAGDINGAIETAALVENYMTKAGAHELIARTHVKSGNVKVALAWAIKQNTPFLKAHTLVAIAEEILDPKTARKNKHRHG